jgi:hypothetical protein
MAKSRREENRQKEPLKTAKEKRKTKRERKTVLKETSFNFTNQYRNTNFTDFHQLILNRNLLKFVQFMAVISLLKKAERKVIFILPFFKI